MGMAKIFKLPFIKHLHDKKKIPQPTEVIIFF